VVETTEDAGRRVAAEGKTVHERGRTEAPRNGRAILHHIRLCATGTAGRQALRPEHHAAAREGQQPAQALGKVRKPWVGEAVAEGPAQGRLGIVLRPPGAVGIDLYFRLGILPDALMEVFLVAQRRNQRGEDPGLPCAVLAREQMDFRKALRTPLGRETDRPVLEGRKVPDRYLGQPHGAKFCGGIAKIKGQIRGCGDDQCD
jgi:hypothetical protein